jgi:glycosyltransferase involved in cell wall biosynthesis
MTVPAIPFSTMKISVLVITYNHEDFIAQSIGSALAQNVDFDYEIVIGEDFSTDRTREIVKDLQRRHAHKIRLLLRDRNLGDRENFLQTLKACKGRYIALLEGDDFWTSPDKLQKQADYLDAHSECVMCFHNTEVVYHPSDRPSHLRNPRNQKRYADLEDVIRSNFISTCSAVIRRDCLSNLPRWYSEMKFGDWALFLACAQQGKIGYLNEVMAAYRIHGGGKWSGRSLDDQVEDATVHFEKVNCIFNSKFEKLIQKALSRVYYSFALRFEAANETEKAKVCALKSLEKNRFNARSLLFFHAPKAFQWLRRVWFSYKQPPTEVVIH